MFFVFVISVILPSPVIAGEVWKQIAKIKIVGSETISDTTILKIAGLKPGDLLFEGEEDCKAAGRRLVSSGMFIVDKAHGVRPTVTFQRDDGWSKSCDILITVEERPWVDRAWTQLEPVAIVLIVGIAVVGGRWWNLKARSSTANQ
jgi:hypothetical protein